MNRPKSISKPDQVVAITADQVVPGMIIAEGIVLEVESTQGGWFFRTPMTAVYADQRQRVEVYAQITNDRMVEQAKATYLERERA